MVKKRQKLYHFFTFSLPNFTEFSFLAINDPDKGWRGSAHGALGPGRPTVRMTKDDFS